jgi:hypothetical protein
LVKDASAIRTKARRRLRRQSLGEHSVNAA